jgi:hypothetical protein
VHELPRKLDPFVDRRRGHPSGFELLVKLFGMTNPPPTPSSPLPPWQNHPQ